MGKKIKLKSILGLSGVFIFVMGTPILSYAETLCPQVLGTEILKQPPFDKNEHAR